MSGSNINGIDVVYYWAKDFDRAKRFYSRLIGFEPEPFSQGACEWTLGDGATFGIVKGTYRPGNGIIFNVSDVARLVKELTTEGVLFEDDGELEETDRCYLAFGTDSEGNSFMLHQRKS